jgi:hypothetical protein
VVLELHAEVTRDEDAGTLQALFFLLPTTPGELSDVCPVFDLRATINGDAVFVERSQHVSKPDALLGRSCRMPAMAYTLRPEQVTTHRALGFPDGAWYLNVVNALALVIEAAAMCTILRVACPSWWKRAALRPIQEHWPSAMPWPSRSTPCPKPRASFS